jgi:two-component system, chemotaxis family, CheB/CheR fusion protein
MLSHELRNPLAAILSAMRVLTGSVFTVWLPLSSEAKAAEARDVAVLPPVRTVVVVEDQADARRMMQFLLEGQGVQVYTAADGAEGVALIERVRPDLAIVDLGLPIMSGFELARRVRANPANTRLRLVALSGYGQDADIQAALASGFDEHLTKPPDPDRLERLLGGSKVGDN